MSGKWRVNRIGFQDALLKLGLICIATGGVGLIFNIEPTPVLYSTLYFGMLLFLGFLFWFLSFIEKNTDEHSSDNNHD